jgi:hypothetical protein
MLQACASAVQWGQEQGCAVAVGHIGRMYHRPNEYVLGIDQQVARAVLDLRAPIIAPGPSTSVVLTAGLSMIAALGWGSRPAFTQTAGCRSRSTGFQRPWTY